MSADEKRTQPLRVLIADDSPFVCRLLTSYLSTAGAQVVGTAHDGSRLVERVRELRPDVLTLDLEMPGTDGLEALSRLMAEAPLPVVVISGVSGRSAVRTLQALELGAVDFVLKYEPGRPTDPRMLEREIVAKVEVAAKIRVVRSLPSRSVERTGAVLRMRPALRNTSAGARIEPSGVPSGVLLPPAGLVVIGASTGGPLALRQLLAELPADFPAAILVVQHIPATFTPVLAAQLDRQVALVVREGRQGDRLEAGLVLVAPGDAHLLPTQEGRVHLQHGPEICGHRPSIDVTMQAAAQHFGSRTTGVLLTGMGEDGVEGLVSIHGRGGLTLGQDAQSSAVYGMPQRAFERGVLRFTASPAELGRYLARELGPPRRRRAC